MRCQRERREFLLSRRASAIVDALAVDHDCNFSDVIEGLLLGNITVKKKSEEPTAGAHLKTERAPG